MSIEPRQGETLTFPVMTTLGEGFIVRQPAAELSPPKVGPSGGVSVGASHLVGVGPVLTIALHSDDGQTLCASMGEVGFLAFATLLSETSQRIVAGEFAKPRPTQ